MTARLRRALVSCRRVLRGTGTLPRCGAAGEGSAGGQWPQPGRSSCQLLPGPPHDEQGQGRPTGSRSASGIAPKLMAAPGGITARLADPGSSPALSQRPQHVGGWRAPSAADYPWPQSSYLHGDEAASGAPASASASASGNAAEPDGRKSSGTGGSPRRHLSAMPDTCASTDESSLGAAGRGTRGALGAILAAGRRAPGNDSENKGRELLLNGRQQSAEGDRRHAERAASGAAASSSGVNGARAGGSPPPGHAGRKPYLKRTAADHLRLRISRVPTRSHPPGLYFLSIARHFCLTHGVGRT